MTPRAAIFDLDGTLVDSALLHEQSWHLLADELRLTVPEGWFHQTFGRANADIIPSLLGRPADRDEIQRHSDRKEALYRQLAATRLTLMPGARDLLDDLHKAGWSLAIGSSTPRENLDFCIPLLGLERLVREYVGMQDVARHKPEPDTFLECARRLRVEPRRAMVFEDAPAGVQAALRGGMKAVALTTHHPADSLAGAVAVRAGLWDVSAEDCAAWLEVC
ncbi:MAG: HAD family phosphatase [Armatimonadetes bacterium]|nr:HAD family phosphatase [Armatimonadota bacterium]